MSIQKIQTFLDDIRKDGKSSPTGKYWNDFYEFLKEAKNTGEPDPPKPLILAASGESDESKHNRLLQQLQWALDQSYLDEALNYLKRLSIDWNVGSLDDWNKSSYFDFE
jgi:hypothetical protein